jgi:ATP-dependent helicase/nuclease subunit A
LFLPIILAEGRRIAEFIQQSIDEKLPVFDKVTGQLRPARPSDFAVLSRTWDPLDLYGEIIANYKIPVVHAGGGNLLDTREAKDAWAMIRFLADPHDDIALMAILRSPFFAVSDKTIANIALNKVDQQSWWDRINQADELRNEADILKELLRFRRLETPSRLLQIADRLTGYRAVIANLPNSERREADWRGFFELVLKFEQTITDISVLVRKISQLIKNEVKVPRPVLEARNAVSLMTIHGAKGLEWPIVIVPDLSRDNPNTTESTYIDAEVGVAFQFEGEDGNMETPSIYGILKYNQKRRETEEAKRLLYVALSRARDQVVLTTTSDTGGSLDLLMPGLKAGGIQFEMVPFDPELDLLRPLIKSDSVYFERELQLEQIDLVFNDISIFDLNDFHLCPARFRFKFYEGHPGFDDEITNNERILRLVRYALKFNIFDIDRLSSVEPLLALDKVREAVTYSKAFLVEPDLINLYEPTEVIFDNAIEYNYNDVLLRGTADIIGKDHVLLLDLSSNFLSEMHLMKAWAVAKATGKKKVQVISLENNEIHTFNEMDLQAIEMKVSPILENLNKRIFNATPTPDICGHCLYKLVCQDSKIDSDSMP